MQSSRDGHEPAGNFHIRTGGQTIMGDNAVGLCYSPHVQEVDDVFLM